MIISYSSEGEVNYIWLNNEGQHKNWEVIKYSSWFDKQN